MSNRDEPYRSKLDGTEIPGHAWVAAERVFYEEEYRKAVCEWIRANGIDPADVPIYAHAHVSRTVAGRNLTIQVYSHGKAGRFTEDPRRPNHPLTHTITVPIMVKPSADIELWLIPD